IGNNAFYGCTGLTSVTIPNSVTNIGNSAFQGCTGLTSVTVNSNSVISKYLKNIFGSQVTQYIIGSDITSIPNTIYIHYSNLTSIVVESGNSTYDSRNDCNAIIETATNSLISGCKNTIIPDNVTRIDNNAFYGCSGLTSIEIPNSVTSIGDGAFWNCSNLTSVTVNSNSIIGNNLRNIFGSQVTQYIIGSDITSIPNTISIGYCNSSGYSDLTSIVVESGNSMYDSRNDCNAIIETATNTLISGCKNTVIPDNVTRIDNNAFYGCSSLTSIEIPNSVTSIGKQAFRKCSGLTSVTIGNSVTSIGDEVFYECKGLTSVTIPNSVTSIAGGAFRNCIGLTSVTIPNSVTIIGNDAFYWCTGLTSIEIPNSVTSIGYKAFYWCTGLTSVTIGNSVTSIGGDAFAYCSSLTSVTIPNSVTSIGSYAFEGCSSLTSVTCLATTPPTCRSSFSGVNCSNIPLYVPMESVSLYQATNDWKEFNVIGVMFADEVETAVFSATPTDDYGVILEWQAVEKAVLYNIDIIQGNDTIRKLQFDSNGKLLNSPSNAPSRYPNIHHASTAILSGNGWRCEVNDLDPGTNHTYSITVKAENGSVLYTQSIGFTTKEETFIIKFVNWNGEELLVLPEVVKGTTPSYTGETPVRPNTAEYTYTFAGWDPAIVAVTGDATYKATFSSVVNVYTISVSAVNGQVIGGGEYQYGATIDLTAIPNEGYVFDQWSDGVKDNPRTITVTGDAEYTALFTSTEGFENIYTSEPVQKVIIDQKVYILRGEKVYTLQGQEVK
ncbi:MAG: leucine-rich repeat protein, partial [Paludibacteraceae bacterium]|nr:leucine-rich repeat protein [Paludibacteraceae bacterium]